MIYLNIFAPEVFKHFIFLNCRNGELHKDSLSFIGCKKRKKKRKNTVFWSGKNRIQSGTSHGILLLTGGGHPEQNFYKSRIYDGINTLHSAKHNMLTTDI